MNESEEVLRERERCALIADRMADMWAKEGRHFLAGEFRELAAAIRQDPDIQVIAK